MEYKTKYIWSDDRNLESPNYESTVFTSARACVCMCVCERERERYSI